MSIEIDNAKQEIKETTERCTKCSLCKPLCPVFKVMREEQHSPRGKAIMLENNHFEKLIYHCTLCKACESQCPVDLKLCTTFTNAKKVLIYQKKELPENVLMINNLEKTGNVFGIVEENI